MSDNPPLSPEPPFALPGHRIVAIDGPQALAFSQAQFMNDVAALQPGQWQWNGWLTPKGRLVALFALLVAGPESVLLLLPDADAATFVAQLQGFVFRTRVRLSIREDLFASASFSANGSASGNLFTGDEQGFDLDFGGESGPRTVRIGRIPGIASDDLASRWKSVDLGYGLPRLPEAQASQWTPQQLSLDRLRAYSVKKGCYPGQEIVARTHFLGQAKRGLALFGADGSVLEGGDVNDGTRSVGTIVSTAPQDRGTRLLAVLPLDRGDAPLFCDGFPLHAQPLAGGLAR